MPSAFDSWLNAPLDRQEREEALAENIEQKFLASDDYKETMVRWLTEELSSGICEISPILRAQIKAEFQTSRTYAGKIDELIEEAESQYDD